EERLSAIIPCRCGNELQRLHGHRRPRRLRNEWPVRSGENASGCGIGAGAAVEPIRLARIHLISQAIGKHSRKVCGTGTAANRSANRAESGCAQIRKVSATLGRGGYGDQAGRHSRHFSRSLVVTEKEEL